MACRLVLAGLRAVARVRPDAPANPPPSQSSRRARLGPPLHSQDAVQGRQCLIPDPIVEAFADRARPALLLAASRRESTLARPATGAGANARTSNLVSTSSKTRGSPATPSTAPFRLEDRVVGERRAKHHFERSYCPDPPLQQEGKPTVRVDRHSLRLTAVFGRKAPSRSVRHWRCVRSTVPPSRWA